MSPGRIHYVTYFDRYYLSRGLALYRSLARHSPPFVLWVLCLDAETHQVLSKLGLDNIVLITLVDLEEADSRLLQVKGSRQPMEYYWTCGPPLLLHVFQQCPRVRAITYLDADLFLFDDPTPLYQELGDGSILLIEHRYSPSVNPSGRAKGTYNVGMLVFRRTPTGLACLARWREQCLDWCFYRLERDRFADQKYLDDWPRRFDGVIVSQHTGAGVGPWNVGNYRFRYEQEKVLVDTEPLVFYHFSRMWALNRWLYEPSLWHWGHAMDPILKRHVYVPYVRELRAADELIRRVGDRRSHHDRLHPQAERARQAKKAQLLRDMVRHGSFLAVTDRFVF
jgi:hypothetical protein